MPNYIVDNTGGVLVVYGGVSTLYAATQLDAGVPIHEFAVYATVSDTVKKTITLNGSVSATVDAGAGFRLGIVEVATEVWCGASAYSAQKLSIVTIGDSSCAFTYEAAYGLAAVLFGDASVVVDTSTAVASSVIPPVEAVIEGDASWIAYGDVYSLFVAIQQDAGIPLHEFAAASGIQSSIGFVVVGSSAWTVYGDAYALFFATQLDTGVPLHQFTAASDISSTVEVENVEEGAAAWSVYGGVSTVYIATQWDAGVPIHNFAVGDATYIYYPTIKTVVYDGLAAEAFTVGDGVTAGTDVILLPILDGIVTEDFGYSSVVNIYATPVYPSTIVEGTAAWRVVRVAAEYWVDTAWDRPIPMHDFSAAADVTTSADQAIVPSAFAVAELAAYADACAGRILTAGVSEVFAAGSGLLVYLRQQIDVVGAAAETFYVPGEYPVYGGAEEGSAAAVFSASCVEVPPYAQRSIYYESDVCSVVVAGTTYSRTGPEAHYIAGDVVFNSESIAELAKSNLFDALAEYEGSVGTGVAVAMWMYSENYTKEPLPVEYNAEGQDGAYTDPPDGAWDEYPVDGAYTSIGYEKEFKPPRRWSTIIRESVPEISRIARGAYTQPGTPGARTTPSSRGAYAVSSVYQKEEKPS